MFSSFLNFLKSLFKGSDIDNSLDGYIVSRQPKTADDVDRLAREFYEKRHTNLY